MWLHVPESCLSAPASECSISDSDLPSMLAQSATWSGKSRPFKSWRTEWQTGRLTPLRFGPISQRLTLEGSGALTFSPAESPANRSHAPANNAETKTIEPSRLMCCGSSQSVCLPWCSSKMFLPGFFSGMLEDSSADFRIWAIASRSRSFAALRILRRRIAESASSLWPTAKAATDGYSYSGGDHSKPIDNLIGAAEKWPSPRVSDTNGPGSHGTGGADLRTTVYQWATPQAFDSTDCQRSPEAHARAKQVGGCSDLREQVVMNFLPPGHPDQKTTGPTSTPKSGRRLNPLFVEWLMGLPRGYTDSAPLGMESFQVWWRLHSGLLWSDAH